MLLDPQAWRDNFGSKADPISMYIPKTRIHSQQVDRFCNRQHSHGQVEEIEKARAEESLNCFGPALFVGDTSQGAVAYPPRKRLKHKASLAKFTNMKLKWNSIDKEQKAKRVQKAKEMAQCVQRAKNNLLNLEKGQRKANHDDSTGAPQPNTINGNSF